MMSNVRLPLHRASDALALVFSLAFWMSPSIGLAALGHQLTPLPEPVSAPDFTLEDMDGKTYTLSELRGKVVLLNFWATWCPPCREEMPSLESLYQSLQDRDFIVLAVNQWESTDQVFPFLAQLDVYPSFPVLFDRKSDVSKSYDVRGLPTTLLIDKRGRVVYRAIGGRNFDHPDVKALIEKLIAMPVED